MIKSIVVLALFISSTAMCQNRDSVKTDTTQLFFREVGDTLTLKGFQAWLYERMTAKQFDEFTQNYQAYLQEKYVAWIQKKRKQ